MAGVHVSSSDDETLTGAAGADTFFVGPDDGNDVVTNFANDEDLIDLTQFPTVSSYSDLTITSDANGVTIDLTAHGGGTILLQGMNIPASCITFLSEQAFAPQNTRFWSRSRVWFQFTVGEDKPPMLSVDNRGKGVLSMDCSAKRSPF